MCIIWNYGIKTCTLYTRPMCCLARCCCSQTAGAALAASRWMYWIGAYWIYLPIYWQKFVSFYDHDFFFLHSKGTENYVVSCVPANAIRLLWLFHILYGTHATISNWILKIGTNSSMVGICPMNVLNKWWPDVHVCDVIFVRGGMINIIRWLSAQSKNQQMNIYSEWVGKVAATSNENKSFSSAIACQKSS